MELSKFHAIRIGKFIGVSSEKRRSSSKVVNVGIRTSTPLTFDITSLCNTFTTSLTLNWLIRDKT